MTGHVKTEVPTAAMEYQYYWSYGFAADGATRMVPIIPPSSCSRMWQ